MENDVLWQVREEKANFIKQFQWFIEVLTPLSEIAGIPVGIMNSNSPRSVASLVFATNFFLLLQYILRFFDVAKMISKYLWFRQNNVFQVQDTQCQDIFPQ